MTVPSPKKTLKDLPKKKTKPKRRPFSEKRKSGAVKKSLRPQERPDVVDLTPPEKTNQLLLKEKVVVKSLKWAWAASVVAWAQQAVVVRLLETDK